MLLFKLHLIHVVLSLNSIQVHAKTNFLLSKLWMFAYTAENYSMHEKIH